MVLFLSCHQVAKKRNLLSCFPGWLNIFYTEFSLFNVDLNCITKCITTKQQSSLNFRKITKPVTKKNYLSCKKKHWIKDLLLLLLLLTINAALQTYFLMTDIVQLSTIKERIFLSFNKVVDWSKKNLNP